MEPAEQELWRRLRHQNDQTARDYLFLRYLPWAKSVARAVASRLRPGVLDWSDHMQNASIGLLEAMSRYDVERGIDFIAYAKPRVRGAVFNGLRALRCGESAYEGQPTADRVESLQHGRSDDSLDEFIDTIVGLGLGLLLESSAAPELVDSSDEYGSILKDALIDLPPRQRDILISHYFMHVPFQDIAARLGVTKGRISQLHKDALARVRTLLRSRRYERDSFF